MALFRFFYRRLSLFGLFFIATTLWIFYLIVSAPVASEKKYEHSVMPEYHMNRAQQRESPQRESITRRVIVAPLVPQDAKQLPDKGQEETIKQIARPEQKVENNESVNKAKEETKQVIPRPPPDLKESEENVHDPLIPKPPDEKEFEKTPKVASNWVDTPKKESALVNAKLNVNKTIINVTKKLEKSDNATKAALLKDMEKKVFEIGEQVKNKTIGDFEHIKNKTIAKLQDLGVIQKPKYVKLIYAQTNWVHNISIEGIGNIMKDTEYLKKKQNVTEMEYQPLLAPNSTLKVANSSYGVGYCDCKDLSCECCVRVVNKWMALNSTACSSITFSSKSQELQFQFDVDKKPYYKNNIAAEFPPKVCMESVSRVTGMCVLFSKVTSKVNIANDDHKIHLSGCMEFDLTLYNKTISAFPVGCFQIPGPSAQSHEENRAQILGNLMP